MLKMYKFKANEVLALDGIHPVECRKDIPMVVPEAMAVKLLAQGRIVEADADTTGYETKATTTNAKTSKPKKKKAAKKKKA